MSDKYTLEELYKKGLINASVLNYKNIIHKVNELRATGMHNGAAVKHIAKLEGVTIQTVYNALKLKGSF